MGKFPTRRTQFRARTLKLCLCWCARYHSPTGTAAGHGRYNYVLLDDGWPACDEWEKPNEPEASGCKNPAPRLENGDVVVDPKKFPPSKPGLNDGIKIDPNRRRIVFWVEAGRTQADRESPTWAANVRLELNVNVYGCP